jgi:hypothetical protein
VVAIIPWKFYILLKEYNMNKLLIVWSTSEIEVVKKMILLYGSVILPRNYWDVAHITSE